MIQYRRIKISASNLGKWNPARGGSLDKVELLLNECRSLGYRLIHFSRRHEHFDEKLELILEGEDQETQGLEKLVHEIQDR